MAFRESDNMSIGHSFSRYRKKRPKLEETFARGLRLLDEHIKRHEAEMYKGSTAANPPVWDAKLAKSGEDLVKSLNSLGQMYLKIQQVNEKMADSMSVEEQIDAFLNWAKDLGRNQWYALLRGFRLIEKEKHDGYSGKKSNDSSE